MCRNVRKNGGAGIFIKDGLNFSKIDLSQFNSELNCEFSCIRLVDYNLIVVSLYRSPNGDLNKFFCVLKRL